MVNLYIPYKLLIQLNLIISVGNKSSNNTQKGNLSIFNNKKCKYYFNLKYSMCVYFQQFISNIINVQPNFKTYFECILLTYFQIHISKRKLLIMLKFNVLAPSI